MLKFYSPGKLLISAEYFVLNGAKAFALPTRKGQHMSVTPNKESFISWKSYTHENKLWMDVKLDIKNFSCIENSSTAPDLIQNCKKYY
jgi:mevalonate kinase